MKSFNSPEELKKSLLLYAITDRHWTGKKTLLEQTREALEGGATMIQIREKDLDEMNFKKEAEELKLLCREFNVPFIVNDNVQLALQIDADGVHVGQSDMRALDVRKLLGKDKIIGVSAATVEEAVLAQEQGADYLGVGAVFPTSSKDDASSVSHEELKKICGSVKIPVVAIGGITKDNVHELKGTGICGISVISAIYGQKDIKAASEDLKKKASETV